MGFLSRLFSKPDRVHTDALTTALMPQVDAAQDDYQLLKQQGSALLDLEKYTEAALLYQKAVQLCPLLSEAHVNFGYVLKELARTEEAKDCFDKAIELDQSNFDAHLLRAMLALADNDVDAALKAANGALAVAPASEDAQKVLYGALALNGDFSQIEEKYKASSPEEKGQANYHFGLSNAFAASAGNSEHKQAALKLATVEAETAVTIAPKNAEMLHHLGVLYLSLNQTSEALELLHRAIAAVPTYFDSLFLMGHVYRGLGNVPQALRHLKNASALQPKNEGVHQALGDGYFQQEAFTDAAASYQTAIDLEPKLFNAWFMLGSTWCELEKFDEALECSQRAIDLEPERPEGHFGLGNVLMGRDEYLPAIESYDKAIELRADYTDAMVNRGSALLRLGDYAAAADAFRLVLVVHPSHAMARSNLAYCSSFDVNCTPEAYLSIVRSWAELVSAKAVPYTTWLCPPVADRPLRVGLVSGDLCMHPVGFFLENVAVHLDIEKIELHAFSNRVKEDSLQLNLKNLCTSWTSIIGMPDKEAARLVHEAQIDVLIDLAGHTNRHRLALFPWRAAPVQVSWLGYWASTGLAEIDYLIADSHAVPEANQAQFSEKIWYLPHTRLCFTPPSKAYELPVSAAPAVKNKAITFGSFQNIRKLTPEVFALWGQIFSQMPTSRFRLQGSGFTTDAIRPGLLRKLAAAGIPQESVLLAGATPRADYFKLHAEVDILLDTFPYTGGTTTCDALWMGVPTVTLAGNTMLSRQGVSIMTCAGLPDWVAQTEAEYVQIAVEKARDMVALSGLRSRLRTALFTSPLFNAPVFAKDFESALQGMAADKLRYL